MAATLASVREAAPSARLVEVAIPGSAAASAPSQLQEALGPLVAAGVYHADIGHVIEIERPQQLEDLHARVATVNGLELGRDGRAGPLPKPAPA